MSGGGDECPDFTAPRLSVMVFISNRSIFVVTYIPCFWFKFPPALLGMCSHRLYWVALMVNHFFNQICKLSLLHNSLSLFTHWLRDYIFLYTKLSSISTKSILSYKIMLYIYILVMTKLNCVDITSFCIQHWEIFWQKSILWDKSHFCRDKMN